MLFTEFFKFFCNKSTNHKGIFRSSFRIRFFILDSLRVDLPTKQSATASYPPFSPLTLDLLAFLEGVVCISSLHQFFNCFVGQYGLICLFTLTFRDGSRIFFGGLFLFFLLGLSLGVNVHSLSQLLTSYSFSLMSRSILCSCHMLILSRKVEWFSARKRLLCCRVGWKVHYPSIFPFLLSCLSLIYCLDRMPSRYRCYHIVQNTSYVFLIR